AYVVVGTQGFGPATIHVVDPNNFNNPVPNAEVGLYSGQFLFDFQTTNDNGIVTFEQVPVGSYTVNGFSKALGNWGSSGITIARNTGGEATISLQFSGKVTGTLTDPMFVPAKGVPGVPITLNATNYQSRASTDTAGAFNFIGIREGFFSLDAMEPTLRRTAHGTGQVTKADPQPRVDLELEPIGDTHIKVVY